MAACIARVAASGLRAAARAASTHALRFSADGVTACARTDAAGLLGVYITPHALRGLGGVAFTDLPEHGAQLVQGRHCAMLESAASQRLMVVSPLTGEVSRRNEALLCADASPPLDQPLWLLDVAGCDEAEWAALQAREA